MRWRLAFVGVAGAAIACALGRQDVSDVCEELIACAEEAGSVQADDYAETYGPDGDCWKNPRSAELCADTCEDALSYLHLALGSDCREGGREDEDPDSGGWSGGGGGGGGGGHDSEWGGGGGGGGGHDSGWGGGGGGGGWDDSD